MSENDSDLPTPVNELPAAGEWQAFPADAAQVAMISGTIWGFLLGLGLALFVATPLLVARDIMPLWSSALMLIGFVLATTVLGIWLGYRRWRFAQWKLDETGLHAKRGHFWRKEILIPRSRVQHLDIERGPIERHFKLATLIVHTAGTRQHALRQSGFNDADAVALRDALVPASDRHDDVL